MKNEGYALVITLWLIILLGLLTGIAYNSARTEVQINAFSRNELTGNALAEAGIWLTVRQLLQQSPDSLSLPYEQVIEFSNTPITIHVSDLAGRININTADSSLLRQLLLSNALDEEEATQLIQAIRDWIDSDSDTPYSSDEAGYYRQAGLSYSPRNQAFSTLSELRLVAGMNDTLYRQLAPYLTVYGRHQQIHAGSADPELVALLTRDTQNENPSAGQQFLTSANSNGFIINSQVLVNGISIENTVIIELTGRRRANAYRILAWYSNNEINKGSPDA